MTEVPQAVEAALIGGDLSKLSSEQRVVYYNRVCESLGLNPLTKPFEYIELPAEGGGKRLTLYAKRDCTEQLRKLQKLSIKIISRELVEDCYVVTAQATTPDGRCDEAIGVSPIKKENGQWNQSENGRRFFKGDGTFSPLTGEARANSMMRAETKAKRRVTLSICGLGWIDESEIAELGQGRQTAIVGTPDQSLVDISASIKQAAAEGKTYEYDLSDCEENTKKLIVGLMKKDGFYASQETRTYHTLKPIALDNAKEYLVNMPESAEVAA